MNATFAHDFHFGFCGIICSSYDGTSMAHSATWRRRLASDETNNWFFVASTFDVLGCFSFHTTTNFTYHNNRICFIIIHKQLHRFFGSSADDGISTNADGS